MTSTSPHEVRLDGQAHILSMLTRWLEHRHAGAILAIIADACFVLMDGLVQVLELKHGLAVEQILLMQMVRVPLLFLPYPV